MIVTKILPLAFAIVLTTGASSESDTPRKAGGLMNGAASKAVTC